MTVFRKIVRMGMSFEEAKGYNPSLGVNVMWLGCIHADGSEHSGVCKVANEVVAEFVTTDRNPAVGESHDATFLDQEIASVELQYRKPLEVDEEGNAVSYSTVVKEELARHNRSPTTAMKVETIVNDETRTQYRTVREVELEEESVNQEIRTRAKSTEERDGKTYYRFDIGVEEG